ncbi:hypothetical protein HDK77DRAFT_70647 [Phyllosticta capitalensis]|uniref:uncharacterized protein n=1 Tax=Phyllosticta capitalensis TaxID=121624 RepID=UPI00312E6C49
MSSAKPDPPQKVATKAETKALKDALATRDITTPPSPHVNRRILSPKLEVELRAACEAILTHNGNSYGVAAAAQAAEQKAETQALYRARKAAEAERTRRKPEQDAATTTRTEARREKHLDPFAPLAPNAYAYKPQAALKDLFPQDDAAKDPSQTKPAPQSELKVAKRENRPTERAVDSKRDKTSGRGTAKDGAHDRPGTGHLVRDPESPDTNYSTPLSGSTDIQRQFGSTAMTSAEPLSIASKRNSHHIPCDDEAARTDAAAVSWMREEGKRVKEQSTTQAQPHKEPRRSGSISRSVRSEIRDYFRPGSSTISRTASRESLWSRNSDALGTQPPPTHGWRSWGFQRKPSQESITTCPANAAVRAEKGRESKKEINLNRELPPLPGLDQWKGPEAENDALAKPTSPTHIANLMQVPKVRSRKDPSQRKPSAEKSRQRPVEPNAHKPSLPRPHNGRRNISTESDVSMHFGPRGETEIRDIGNVDLDRVVSAMRYGGKPKMDGNKSNPSLVDSGHGQDEVEPSRKPSMKISIEHISNSEAPNFSKKISGIDSKHEAASPPAAAIVDTTQYKNKVEITTKPTSNSHNVRGLKKAFSSLLLGNKKEKKNENWMDEIEKNGIKGGILIQDEVAGAPVVRY